jgi:hypothetical protein
LSQLVQPGAAPFVLFKGCGFKWSTTGKYR